MVDFKDLADKAKQIVDERGGIQSVEEDAKEVDGILTGDGSLTDKAKEAFKAIKEPGAPETGQ
jgi:hypothetical protein